MKLSHRQRSGIRLELSMTSMIDVVFLLLIFFLVTTTFSRPQRQVASNIVVDEQGAANSEMDLEPALIDVTMEQGTVIYTLGGVTSSDVGEIASVLEVFQGKEQGAFVRVADEVPFGAAANLIGVCRDSGFDIVSYLPLK